MFHLQSTSARNPRKIGLAALRASWRMNWKVRNHSTLSEIFTTTNIEASWRLPREEREQTRQLVRSATKFSLFNSSQRLKIMSDTMCEPKNYVQGCCCRAHVRSVRHIECAGSWISLNLSTMPQILKLRLLWHSTWTFIILLSENFSYYV